ELAQFLDHRRPGDLTEAGRDPVLDADGGQPVDRGKERGEARHVAGAVQLEGWRRHRRLDVRQPLGRDLVERVGAGADVYFWPADEPTRNGLGEQARADLLSFCRICLARGEVVGPAVGGEAREVDAGAGVAPELESLSCSR